MVFRDIKAAENGALNHRLADSIEGIRNGDFGNRRG